MKWIKVSKELPLYYNIVLSFYCANLKSLEEDKEGWKDFKLSDYYPVMFVYRSDSGDWNDSITDQTISPPDYWIYLHDIPRPN